MKLKSWEVAITSGGFYRHNGAAARVRLVVSCPVCHHEFSRQQHAELSPWEVSERKNISVWAVGRAAGDKNGLYCPNCQVLSRVNPAELEQLSETVRETVTTQLLEQALDSLPVEKVTRSHRTVYDTVEDYASYNLPNDMEPVLVTSQAWSS